MSSGAAAVMRYQRSALRHRVSPPSSRPHEYATESLLGYPTKLDWFVPWPGASVWLVVLGALLEMHC
jgi:hypothetical protein